jgi:tetratricopeptide (TPR) repeat protein
MALSQYGHQVSQQTLGQKLRPYQNPQGDNDDKSTTLEELADEAQNYSLTPYHRPAGDTQIIKKLLALDLPVITRTLLKEGEDIGHYRVVKGYDDARQIFIQDDSLQGKNLEYTYSDFNKLWQPYNYEFLVLSPHSKQAQVEAALGELASVDTAWNKAKNISDEQLQQNPNNFIAQFNRSVAWYHLGNYQQSITDFEAVQSALPMRHLWYQIEPIQAYFELKNYQSVLNLSRQILDNNNRAFSELYLLRGQAYQALGQASLAQTEFNQAVRYNSNFASKIPAM